MKGIGHREREREGRGGSEREKKEKEERIDSFTGLLRYKRRNASEGI